MSLNFPQTTLFLFPPQKLIRFSKFKFLILGQNVFLAIIKKNILLVLRTVNKLEYILASIQGYNTIAYTWWNYKCKKKYQIEWNHVKTLKQNTVGFYESYIIRSW